jgi:hypothetical protein
MRVVCLVRAMGVLRAPASSEENHIRQNMYESDNKSR